jgi:hypothetical protein
MNITQTFVASRSRVWTLRVLLLVLIALAAALAASVVVRQERWRARLQDVRFVDRVEKISGGGAALSVSGYVVVRVESDVDFFRLARDEEAYPQVSAALCDSGRELGAWRDPLPVERPAGERRFVYAVLLPARGRDVDLAQAGEDVCLRFADRGGGPLSWVGSRPLRVPLAPALREQLADYGRRDGVVDLVLDPKCAPQLCQPDYSARVLKR